MKLTEAQRKQFASEGYMLVPEFFSLEELELVRSICNESIAEIEADMSAKGIAEDGINVYGKKYFIHNAWKKHSALRPVIFSEKIAAVCCATIGNKAFLHNEQFVVKMKDSNTSFAWHQDSGYSVFKGGAAPHQPYLTCWIALDDMSATNGTISVMPFSRAPSQELMEHVWDSNLNAMVGYGGEDPGDLIEVAAGTLVAFSSFLLHKSGPNYSNHPRRSYFIAYTPELFPYLDREKGIYSCGNPVCFEGKLVKQGG